MNEGQAAGDHGTIDLSECEREPIHIPGSIQPHGVLLSIQEPALTIVQASDNVGVILNIPIDRLLGRPLSSALGDIATALIQRALEHSSLEAANPLRIAAFGKVFDGILHRSGGLLVLELEPPSPRGARSWEQLWQALQTAVEQMQKVASVAELLHVAAAHTKHITGFDRVMIYLFHKDDHGEVVAESREEGMESWLHQHYPASDIPAQARRLYALNRLRLIPDIEYEPVAIVPTDNPLTGDPLDLSYAVLRSVSPIHVEYLRNMGARASMSISLLDAGRLYGLIACHHRTGRHVGYRTRRICDLLGQMLSWQIATRLRSEAVAKVHQGERMVGRIVARVVENDDLLQACVDESESLLGLVSASGVAVCYQGEWRLIGKTPTEDDVRALAMWMNANMSENLFVTDALPAQYPEAERFKDLASGLLAIAFPRKSDNFVCWFRTEARFSVRWGGDPNEPAIRDPTTQHIGPRRSFAVWQQDVSGRSMPWESYQIDLACAFKSGVMEIVLRKATELARLNADLEVAVRARDDFLSMASHELRTPVHTMGLQIQGLTRAARRGGDLAAGWALPRLEIATRQIKRLEQLIEALLDITKIRAGRIPLNLEDVNLLSLVDEVVASFEDALSRARCAMMVCVEPDIVGHWDRMLLEQVLGNLLSNAMKYGAGASVEIEGKRHGEQVCIAVIDHGIGIDLAAQARIFERFERAVSTSHYGGLGLGLWIVRQIVERFGGTIHVRSEPGRGASFILEIPRVVTEQVGKMSKAA